MLLFHNQKLTIGLLLKNMSIANTVQLPFLMHPNHDMLIILIVHGRKYHDIGIYNLSVLVTTSIRHRNI